MVWGAVSTKGLIGPYFFHSNGSNITVDGATPHTALSTRRYLKDIFGKLYLSNHTR